MFKLLCLEFIALYSTLKSFDRVKEIISRGQKWRENTTVHARTRGVEVVYKIVNSEVFVITVYYG
jgi:hypothetical protein